MNIFLSVIFILSLCRGLMNLQTSDGLILFDLKKKDMSFLPKALKQNAQMMF